MQSAVVYIYVITAAFSFLLHLLYPPPLFAFTVRVEYSVNYPLLLVSSFQNAQTVQELRGLRLTTWNPEVKKGKFTTKVRKEVVKEPKEQLYSTWKSEIRGISKFS